MRDCRATKGAMVQRILQTVAWLLAVAIAVLSLVPPWYRPMTGMPHPLEHFGVFFAMALAFRLGYSTSYLSLFLPLIAFTAAIEIAQLWAPGRHARFSDFLVNVLGLAIGLGLGLWQARHRDPSPQRRRHGGDQT